MSAQTIDIIPGFASASPEELSSLDEKLVRERNWYRDKPRFMLDEDVEAAFLLGDLVEIHNTDDVRRISRFEGEGRNENKPYLTPRAAKMLEDFSGLWRVILWQEYHIQTGETRLAVTSMARSQARQDAIVRTAGKLASPDSTHCTVNAVDIDASGYYSVWNDGLVETHMHPERARNLVGETTDRLRARFGDNGSNPTHAAVYDYHITEAAIRAATQMHETGSINLVHEFVDTPNATLHLAVNPDYPL